MQVLKSVLLRPQYSTLGRNLARRSSSQLLDTRHIFTNDSDYASVRTGDPQPGDANENLKGWALALQRAHDVILECSERRFQKTLHLYPDTEFVLGFGKVLDYVDEIYMWKCMYICIYIINLARALS
jgi:hypothetical protein